MSRIGKLPVPVPVGVDVAIDGQQVTVKGPKGTLSPHRRRADHRRAGRRHARRGPSGRRARVQVAARPVAHADRQHGDRRDRGYIEDARDRRHRLPGRGQGQRPRVRARVLAPGRWSRRRTASRSGSRRRPGSRSRASTSRRSARWPPTSASCASPTRTRARACATRVRSSAARPERQVRSNGRLNDRQAGAPVGRRVGRPAHRQGRAGTSGCARRSSAPPSVRGWSSPAPSRHLFVAGRRRQQGRHPRVGLDLQADRRRQDRAGQGRSARQLAEAAKAAGVTKVVFDRGGNTYTGRIAAFADAAREAGLEF